MQYLKYILEQQDIQEAIESSSNSLLEIFTDSFSTKKIYKQVEENLTNLIEKEDSNLTFSNIRQYATTLTLDYLNNKSKELAKLNQ